ncbi:hypothetical protein CEP54_004631 [Fusarium duplospermum]|uniref:Uncharacterized protein n=1 Tax=Fusarium duplospermum TaxID=1325734 RepID=A0A428QHZ3_9HYPO|nr:hypothetical protein CEP54_004631 [Fusarium duplospermum]
MTWSDDAMLDLISNDSDAILLLVVIFEQLVIAMDLALLCSSAAEGLFSFTLVITVAPIVDTWTEASGDSATNS